MGGADGSCVLSLVMLIEMISSRIRPGSGVAAAARGPCRTDFAH
jgi:hypothetical protein